MQTTIYLERKWRDTRFRVIRLFTQWQANESEVNVFKAVVTPNQYIPDKSCHREGLSVVGLVL